MDETVEIPDIEWEKTPKKPPKHKHSLFTNYFNTVLYQIVTILVPLVVTPYISQVLLPEGVGHYSFSYSVITFFTIFGALGFNMYGQRQIARHQTSKTTQSLIFWELVIARLGSVLIALAVNITLSSLGVYGDYTPLMNIMNINIVAVAFDIAFLFQGNEEFGKVATLNTISKVLGVIFIFIFVKSANDLWIYTLIKSSVFLLGYLTVWLIAPLKLRRVSIKQINPLRHWKGVLILFIPEIAISIYTVLDRTLIGLLIDGYNSSGAKLSDIQNGYYEQSEKIVRLVITVVTAIGTVMIARNASEYKQGHSDIVKDNIYKAGRAIWLIGTPMAFGFAAIAPNFVPWFFGTGYDECITLIRIFCPIIIFIGFTNLFGIQYLVPTKREKQYAIALIMGAIFNLTLNIFLIRVFQGISFNVPWDENGHGAVGAAIASVIAELAVTSTMAFMVRKDINVLKIIAMSWRYIFSGAVMFISLYFLEKVMVANIGNTFLLILAGIGIYGMMLIATVDPFIFFFIRKIMNKIPLHKVSIGLNIFGLLFNVAYAVLMIILFVKLDDYLYPLYDFIAGRFLSFIPIGVFRVFYIAWIFLSLAASIFAFAWVLFSFIKIRRKDNKKRMHIFIIVCGGLINNIFYLVGGIFGLSYLIREQERIQKENEEMKVLIEKEDEVE